MGWQPFCFIECFDIKLEEVLQLMYHFYIFPYSTCIIMIICKYIYTLYIPKHTINYGDLLSVCDICILCIV